MRHYHLDHLDVDEAVRTLKKANRAMEEALRVIALSYKYRIDKKDTSPYEYARTVLEELGISLDSIPDEQFSLEVRHD